MCACLSGPWASARGEDVRAALQRVADRMAQKYNMSLAAAYYSLEEQVEVASGFTDSGIGLGKPARRARPDDPYVWGSTTKMFTAPAVLQLVARGVLALADPISMHVDPILLRLNGTRLRDHFGSRIDEVRVEHLMHMTSGIADYDGAAFTRDQFLQREKAFGPVEILGRYVSPALEFAPGTRQAYCSTNYILLGLVLARHSHKVGTGWSWQSYDQMDVIPAPLRAAYSRSRFATAGPCADFTPVHGFLESYVDIDLPEQDVWNVSCVGGWTAGNFVGPVADVARFTYELYNRRRPSIVPADMQAHLTDFAPPRWPGRPFKFYGMGTFSLDWSIGDGEAYGHVGDTYGYQSQTTYFPDEDFVLAVATNVELGSQAQPADFTCAAYHEVLAARRGTASPTCTFHVPRRFIGKCSCSYDVVV